MYEGRYDTPIQGAFCGVNYPSEIITNSTEMVIEFHSDDYGADAGFRIKIETGTIAIHTIKVNVNIFLSLIDLNYYLHHMHSHIEII